MVHGDRVGQPTEVVSRSPILWVDLQQLELWLRCHQRCWKFTMIRGRTTCPKAGRSAESLSRTDSAKYIWYHDQLAPTDHRYFLENYSDPSNVDIFVCCLLSHARHYSFTIRSCTLLSPVTRHHHHHHLVATIYPSNSRCCSVSGIATSLAAVNKYVCALSIII